MKAESITGSGLIGQAIIEAFNLMANNGRRDGDNVVLCPLLVRDRNGDLRETTLGKDKGGVFVNLSEGGKAEGGKGHSSRLFFTLSGGVEIDEKGGITRWKDHELYDFVDRLKTAHDEAPRGGA